MPNRKFFFIVFEGIEGSGKSYQSRKLYKNIVSGGSVIFDEYYSHKYPGARIAVNEFFENKKGYFEKYITPEGFERWCFIKE